MRNEVAEAQLKVDKKNTKMKQWKARSFIEYGKRKMEEDTFRSRNATLQLKLMEAKEVAKTERERADGIEVAAQVADFMAMVNPPAPDPYEFDGSDEERDGERTTMAHPFV